MVFSGFRLSVIWIEPDVLDEHIAFIFRVEAASLPPISTGFLSFSYALNMEAVCSSETLGCV
jgi:hypothetical protein